MIAEDDPTAADVLALIAEHLAEMRSISPPESVHALEPASLAGAGMTFWTARDGDGALLGMAAVKDHGDGTGELKSMRTATAARGTGVGRRLLEHAVDAARSRGWRALRLETGSEPHFAPARTLYLARGFVPCPPFAAYTDDPNSVYLELILA